jgi:hypothetical protein
MIVINRVIPSFDLILETARRLLNTSSRRHYFAPARHNILIGGRRPRRNRNLSESIFLPSRLSPPLVLIPNPVD